MKQNSPELQQKVDQVKNKYNQIRSQIRHTPLHENVFHESMRALHNQESEELKELYNNEA